MVEKTNRKLDLFWIVPELIFSLGIFITIGYKITEFGKLLSIDNDIFSFIFNMSLICLVLGLGYKSLSKGLDEGQKIKW